MPQQQNELCKFAYETELNEGYRKVLTSRAKESSVRLHWDDRDYGVLYRRMEEEKEGVRGVWKRIGTATGFPFHKFLLGNNRMVGPLDGRHLFSFPSPPPITP